MSAPQQLTWTSGWFGLDAYETRTHGFAECGRSSNSLGL
jgi:hypothetical protein